MNKYCKLADSLSKAPIDNSVRNGLIDDSLSKAPIDNSVKNAPKDDSTGNVPTEHSAGKTPMVKVAVHKAQRAIEKLF